MIIGVINTLGTRHDLWILPKVAVRGVGHPICLHVILAVLCIDFAKLSGFDFHIRLWIKECVDGDWYASNRKG
jgi:hypothetical protein